MNIDAHTTSSASAEAVQAKAEARLLLEENGRLREALHAIATTSLDDHGAIPAPSVVWALANQMQNIARAVLKGGGSHER